MTINVETNKIPDDKSWQKLMHAGAWAAIAVVALIPFQIAVFAVYPPPESVAGFFELFQKNWFRGLLSLDLLYILNNTLEN